MAVSVRDVAAAAGVSIASVSRVLNRSGYVSAAVRERVDAAVRATGYTPSFSARHLRTDRIRAVGFMVSNMANPLLAMFFAAMEARMQEAGYSLLVASTYDRPEKERELLALFENRRLDGLVVAPSIEGLPRDLDPFARCTLPLLVLDRDIDCDGDVVLQDHRDGVRQAVEHLATLGHRRIALFGPSLAIRPGREKLAGYRDGLAAHGLAYDPALVCMLRSAVDRPQAEMAEMLELAAPPSALIALGTNILAATLRAARAAGRRIPHDLSVIGIGHEQAFALMDPTPTTLRIDIDGAADAGARMLLQRLAGTTPLPPRREVLLPMRLIPGASCAAP